MWSNSLWKRCTNAWKTKYTTNSTCKWEEWLLSIGNLKDYWRKLTKNLQHMPMCLIYKRKWKKSKDYPRQPLTNWERKKKNSLPNLLKKEIIVGTRKGKGTNSLKKTLGLKKIWISIKMLFLIKRFKILTPNLH